MTDLGRWLMDLGGRRRELGVHDCCTLPGDWTVAQGFPDPMKAWRDAYVTEDDVADVFEQSGGLLPLFERGYEDAGIPERIGDPLAGDVALLEFEGFEAGSIFTGRRWAFVATRGVGFANVDPENVRKVWAVGHG